MNGLIKINDTEITIKEYKGQRVVTFAEIDSVHSRNEGTARKRFNDNRKHFIEGVDYFSLHHGDKLMSEKRTLEIPNRGLTLITETGYLMLVKSFTDNLAWKVQRELVNHYFSRSPAKLAQVKPKETADELIRNIGKRSDAVRVLIEEYGSLAGCDSQIALSESLKVVSFSMYFIASKLVMMNKELPGQTKLIGWSAPALES